MSKREICVCAYGLLVALAALLPAGAAEIHEAVKAGDEARVTELLRADPALASLPDEQDQYHSLPLHHAALDGRIAIAEALLKAGADVDGGDDDDSRPLDLAASAGQIEMIKFLLEHGADVNQQDNNGSCPLSFAVSRGQMEAVELLIARGADVNGADRNGINGLFLRTADLGDVKMLTMLLERGADLHFAHELGGMVMHRAAQMGRLEAIAYLAEQGADVNATDYRGCTPLIRAAQRNRPAAIPVLLAHGARVDQATWKERQTPLHYAALNGRAESVAALLAGGADVHATDARGRRPIDLAACHGHRGVVEMLAAHESGEIPAVAGSPLAEYTDLRDGETVVMYLNHSGYAVKTSRHLVIFDYWEAQGGQPDEPNLCNGRILPAEIAGENVVVFVSHIHTDHYDPVIFSWREQVPGITYVMGCQPEGAEDYIYMAGRQTRRIGDLQVRTIESNDTGVGFVVEVDGLTLFHAGDHANRLRDFSGTYLPEIKYLVAHDVHPDIAILPVTGCRFRDQVAVKLGVHHFLEILKPKMFLPAHAGGGEFRYADFAEECRGRFPATRVCAPEFDGDLFLFHTPEDALTMRGSD